MNKKLISFISCVLILATTALWPRSGVNLFKQVDTPFACEKVVSDQRLLMDAAEDALLHFKMKQDKCKIHSTLFSDSLISTADTRKTLQFIVDTARADRKTGGHRLADPKFIVQHFKCIKWTGDADKARKNNVQIPVWPDGGTLVDGKIKLTSYASFRLHGSPKKTEEYPCALYALKNHVDYLSYCPQFTKQDCINGVFEKPEHHSFVKPLVWLTRAGMEEALLQGSAIVKMPNGKQRLFNVHKSNEIPYDKQIKNSWDQKRFWFFKEVECAVGSTGKEHMRHINYAGVVFAGDVYRMGLGKIIGLKYQNPITKQEELRLGVLLDTGGAFEDNLYQIDLYAGIFDNREQFKDYIKQMPNTVHAYILVKK